MSFAATQASKFYEQVVRDGLVFTFEDAEGLLVFPIRGIEVVPFWSSRERLEQIQKKMPKYAIYRIEVTPFEDFYARTLPWLEKQNIHIGVNWSGERLTGYDVSALDLRKNLDYWRAKNEPNKA